MRNLLVCLLLPLGLAIILTAGTAPAQDTGAHRPAGSTKVGPSSAAKIVAPVNPDDARSLDSILASLYSVISGAAGEPRNWDRFRSLFWPGARLIALGPAKHDKISTRAFTVEDYVGRATPVLAVQGFFEREIGRHVDEYEHLLQVFSVYESRHAPGEHPFERGINAIRLLNDGHRWWIVDIFWEPEAPSHPIPEKYLQN